ncbi:Eukaryotic translation initiation factor 4E-binding protein 2 [Lemmus lemmus]
MSASAGGCHQPSQSRAIPTRTVAISDAAQLPQDYSTTPGGDAVLHDAGRNTNHL